jgi:hypothetical protein
MADVVNVSSLPNGSLNQGDWVATLIAALLCKKLMPAKDIPLSPPLPNKTNDLGQKCNRTDNDCAARGVFNQGAVCSYCKTGFGQ